MGLKAMLIRVLASLRTGPALPCFQRATKFLVNGNGVRKKGKPKALDLEEKRKMKRKRKTQVVHAEYCS